MKFNIKKFTDKVKEGEINPLEFYAELKVLEEALKTAKEEIQPLAIDEYEKHGGKPIVQYGFEISASASGRYDYSNNEDWVNKNKSIKELEKRMQNAFKAGVTGLDESTGELIPPAEYKPNKTSLRLKKK